MIFQSPGSADSGQPTTRTVSRSVPSQCFVSLQRKVFEGAPDQSRSSSQCSNHVHGETAQMLSGVIESRERRVSMRLMQFMGWRNTTSRVRSSVHRHCLIPPVLDPTAESDPTDSTPGELPLGRLHTDQPMGFKQVSCFVCASQLKPPLDLSEGTNHFGSMWL